MGGNMDIGIDGEIVLDKVFCVVGNVVLVFDGGEVVVSVENGLYFFEVGVVIEWCVVVEEEVCNDIGSLKVDGFVVFGFFEDFGCYVVWCVICCSENVVLFFFYDMREIEVCDKKICIVFWSMKE